MSGPNEIYITGGKFGDDMKIGFGSMVDITDAMIGINLSVTGSSTLNISGGTIGKGLHVTFGSEIHLTVTEAFLDGIPVNFSNGDLLEITQRGGALLSGTLAFGDSFEFLLSEIDIPGQDYFSPNATLTVTLVPAPSTLGVLALGGLALTRRRRQPVLATAAL